MKREFQRLVQFPKHLTFVNLVFKERLRDKRRQHREDWQPLGLSPARLAHSTPRPHNPKGLAGWGQTGSWHTSESRVRGCEGLSGPRGFCAHRRAARLTLSLSPGVKRRPGRGSHNTRSGGARASGGPAGVGDPGPGGPAVRVLAGGVQPQPKEGEALGALTRGAAGGGS